MRRYGEWDTKLKNRFLSIRYKIIIAFIESAALAGVTMFLMFLALATIEYSNLNKLIKWINNNIILVFLISLVLFVFIMNIYFYMFTRSSMEYVDEINKTLGKIAKGDLEINIPVKRSDELGELGTAVNTMAFKLNTLIEEERSWERVKNDLITNVSHDLRTPLTSILGYLELINNAKYTDEDNLKQYSNIAYSKGKELKLLIDDLFEYSKLNNDEMKISKIDINLIELIEQVVIGFMPTLNENGMEYRLLLPKEKITINADPTLMARLFNNLINNAINYGKEGKYVDIELVKDTENILVRIINYGRPIPEEDLPYIFDKFYRVEKSRSKNNGGSGLGLAIVKSIVDKHDGSIKVQNYENKIVFEVGLKI